MNERLQSFKRQQSTICKNQISFQQKRRTTDHILTLKTLINQHVKDKSKQKVHAAFIDFAKAFDTVWHKGLFHKLQRNGIEGNFLHLIKDMYQKIECAVKIGSQHTSFFKCPRGVRQGCPLSPTFFNIYINDLAEKMNDAKNTPPLNFGNKNISCLMYADDLIILSLTHQGLQNCLDALSDYCNEWRLVINKSKSKCMTFHKRNKKYDKAFLIDNTPLENVTDYTYLGLNIDASCSFKGTHKLLASKANRAIFALNSRLS